MQPHLIEQAAHRFVYGQQGQPCSRCSRRNTTCSYSAPKKRASTKKPKVTNEEPLAISSNPFATSAGDKLLKTSQNASTGSGSIYSNLPSFLTDLMAEDLRPLLNVDGMPLRYTSPFPASLDSSPQDGLAVDPTDPYHPNQELKKEMQRNFIRQARLIGWYTNDVHLHKIDNYYTQMKDRQERVANFFTEEQARQMREDLRGQLERCVEGSDQTDVPTMVSLQFGVVHHVNQAFRDFTGFCEATPTPYDRFLWMESFRYTFKSFDYQRNFINNENNYCSSRFVMYPGELKIWNNQLSLPVTERESPITKEKEFFIECVMTLTVKKDMMGVPIIFIASFVPSTSALLKISEVWRGQWWTGDEKIKF
ncbi:hypothetical protein PROFUN_01922 [Planoprotostelium fungivorum]|uniref:Uncharacterized protein n=1 Tax=Planoprotostelium fungivorum TaxID=1890364 RepID=A0A2P6NZ29_9EUKA|nr:hypothetical protein PROFUN_01922 [Planoprotostelium fungivorum]